MPKKGKGKKYPYTPSRENTPKFEAIIHKTKLSIIPGIQDHWPIRRDRINQLMTWPGMESITF